MKIIKPSQVFVLNNLNFLVGENQWNSNLSGTALQGGDKSITVLSPFKKDFGSGQNISFHS